MWSKHGKYVAGQSPWQNLFSAVFALKLKIYFKFQIQQSGWEYISEPATAAMHGPHSLVRIGPGCAGRT